MKLAPEVRQHLEYVTKINQEAPRLGNRYLEDTALREYVEEALLKKSPAFVRELERLGDRITTLYLPAARDAERNPPVLEQFDSYGQRIDKIHLSEGWRRLGVLSAEDGIVSLAYEQDKFKLGDMQRFGQLVVLMMYQPAGLYGCPLAMTDGAAFTIQYIFKNEKKLPGTQLDKLKEPFRRLTTRNPTEAWTSGQWMTEKRGGSDVSNTETIAYQDGSSGQYRLYGYKWFTSATDSQMTLALAKIIPEGHKDLSTESLQKLPLSLFYVEMRASDGQLNNMEIIRMKDKLGTRQLPTAEILLKGSRATLVSEPGRGVKYISNMLSVTRLYNAASSVTAIRRILALARDYSTKRIVGKKLLMDSPLHLSVLADMEVIYRGNLLFYLKLSELFSKFQAGTISDPDSNILRMMIPLLKLFTAKQAMATVSQGLECFGGLGYIEGTGLPGMLRDTQVLTIWEGTTNVLCLDFVRSLYKSPHGDPIQSFCAFALRIIEGATIAEIRNKLFEQNYVKLVDAYNKLVGQLKEAKEKMFKNKEHELRAFCFGVCRVFVALLLCNQALNDPRSKHIEVFSRWVSMKELYVNHHNDVPQQTIQTVRERELALDIDSTNQMRSKGEADSRGHLRPRF